MTAEARIELDDERLAARLYGSGDRNLRLVRELHGVKVVARNGVIKLQGETDAVSAARDALLRLQAETTRLGPLSFEQARDVILGETAAEDGQPRARVGLDLPAVHPKSPGQRRYVEAIEAADIVFSIGPAGTGKTFLAVAMAVAALRRGRVRRIVLVRPAVEAGEKLGFLPGDYQAKINPYLRPLYDALGALLSPPEISRLTEKDQIEIVPLAYMRGRTLQDAFIIMDEAQNTTPRQMKMFLTRLGVRSRAVITGDVTQVDLGPGQASGLVHAQQVLGKVDGIGFVELGKEDIVRHRLVQAIVDAYERKDAEGAGSLIRRADGSPA